MATEMLMKLHERMEEQRAANHQDIRRRPHHLRLVSDATNGQRAIETRRVWGGSAALELAQPEPSGPTSRPVQACMCQHESNQATSEHGLAGRQRNADISRSPSTQVEGALPVPLAHCPRSKPPFTHAIARLWAQVRTIQVGSGVLERFHSDRFVQRLERLH